LKDTTPACDRLFRTPRLWARSRKGTPGGTGGAKRAQNREVIRPPYDRLHSRRRLAPGACDVVGTPASASRLAREAIAGQRGQNEIEGVLRASSIGRGIGERTDDLQEFYGRAGSALDDEKQGGSVH
jgi:hypothetical protein